MPRKPRMYIAGYPYHVIQRGNNRDACFYSEADYLFYLEKLYSACYRYKVSLELKGSVTNDTLIIYRLNLLMLA